MLKFFPLLMKFLLLFQLQGGTLEVPAEKYRCRRPSSSAASTVSSSSYTMNNDNVEGGSYTNIPNYHHYPDYAHSDGGSVTPPPSPSSSIVSLVSNNSSNASSTDNISYYLLDQQQQKQPYTKTQSTNKKSVQTSSLTNGSTKTNSNININAEPVIAAAETQETEASCGEEDLEEVEYASRSDTEDTTDVLNNNFSCNLNITETTTPSTNDCNNESSSKITEIPTSSPVSFSQQEQLLQQQQSDQQRLAVLSFEQVKKLNDVMNEHVSIHGRGNFPTLEVRLKDLVTLVREKLELDVHDGGAGMCVKDIRLNGGCASHVLAYEAQSYNDLDLIFAVEFSSNRHFDRVKSAVLSSLFDLLPEGVSRKRITQCSLKEAYVGKMVKVNNNNDGDRWSLISLGNSPGHKNVELKFVDTMRRQFEFSVDSFQIVLDSLLLFYDCAELPISENFYPTVVGESVYGDFHEALYHLQNKLISTRQPEEIRGGGLLKYCNLLVRNYIPVDIKKIKLLERYMCSRFFIDFPDIKQQEIKLNGYLRNHFWGIDEEPLQHQYLLHLHEVVETSTVCLMGHERRQTLRLIEELAVQVLCREQQKIQYYQQMQHQSHKQQNQLIPPQSQLQQNISHHHSHNPHLIPQHQQNTHPHHQSVANTSQYQSHYQPAQMCTVTQQPSNQNQVTPQTITATTTSVTQPPQQIQLQPTSQPGLLYANGVYYAPVIPTTFCTCNSTWLST